MNYIYFINRVKRRLRHLLNIEKLDWRRFPLVIQVDTNNHCGQRYCKIGPCTYCFPQWQIVRKERTYLEMPMAWIKWILKEVNRDGKSMGFIDWFLNGDGLTEPRLPEILRLSKKYAPWLRTQTFTCGVLTDNVDLILDDNLDSICFTISAHNRELYRQIHRGDMFDAAIRTLETVLERRHAKQNVEVHCVLTKDNIAYAQEWWDFFGKYDGLKRVLSPLVASYDNLPSKQALGDLTLDAQEETVLKIAGVEGRMWTREHLPPSKPCVLWDNCSIDVSGALLQCCNWSNYLEWNYGFIEDFIAEGRTLKEYWISRLANKMNNKLCRSCNMKHKDWKHRINSIQINVSVR